ncbi:hypothetical protein JCM4814A_01130 [Streptomyces phaeofaciens JCM 4814]|uniref:Uncharacterized protein n=1 Tax=Streptomyces phaeofaciens TaxID=68254 RepID=A0A918M109_9ACTN|nr:hypothetical protein [Streptomyces phaeofaciens]GGT91999.1 hypothetical protein GCM10010226_82450 [Streptomyces phaeofaciens]
MIDVAPKAQAYWRRWRNPTTPTTAMSPPRTPRQAMAVMATLPNSSTRPRDQARTRLKTLVVHDPETCDVIPADRCLSDHGRGKPNIPESHLATTAVRTAQALALADRNNDEVSSDFTILGEHTVRAPATWRLPRR